MRRILAVALLSLIPLLGCAGHEELTRRSEEKLATGEPWRAWSLATKALDKAPGNPRARAAATAASAAIAGEWQRKIHALAQTDSVAAAGQVLEFVAFRHGAARYATVPLPGTWPAQEAALRTTAAHVHTARGAQALDSGRPKRAYLELIEAERFTPEDPAIEQLADRAWRAAFTRVAFAPLRVGSGAPPIGRDVASSWRGELSGRLTAPAVTFTHVLPIEDVERRLSVAQLDRMSRDDAIRAAADAGADRVVWGTIGEARSRTSFGLFSDVVARRVVQKDKQGNRNTYWVDVPIEVISRTRTVTVPVTYEVIDTHSGATLAHRTETCEERGRVLWTTYAPEGGSDTYTLVPDAVRTADPARAKRVESRWKEVVGEGISIAQVIEARHSSRGARPDRSEVRMRLLAGAAFVFLEELPSTEDLAYAAVAGRWKPVYQDLVRLDATDDADLDLAIGAR